MTSVTAMTATTDGEKQPPQIDGQDQPTNDHANIVATKTNIQTISLEDHDLRCKESRTLFLIGIFGFLVSLILLWMPIASFVAMATSMGASLYNIMCNLHPDVGKKTKKYAIGSIVILFLYLTLVVVVISTFVILMNITLIFGVNLNSAVYLFHRNGNEEGRVLEGP